MTPVERVLAALETRAVAEWLGVAVSTVYDAPGRDILPAVKLRKGKRRTFSETEGNQA